MIKKIRIRVSEYYKLTRNFGIKVSAIDIINRYVFNENKNNIGKKWHYLKYSNAKRYIYEKYGNIIKKNKYEKLSSLIKKDDPIWVFWYQGLSNAPDIVKICVASIKKNAGNHRVIIITKSNLLQYVNMPKYILEKVDSGQITLTHFSDILRMALLYEHGGIWSDATLFWSDSINNHFNDSTFITINHGLFSDYHVCKGKWTGFFIGASKNNPAIKLFRDIFYEYWKNENCLYCYYLIDVIIATCYDNVDYVRDMIDDVPINNTSVFELNKILNEPYNKEQFDRLLRRNWLHKLSYKTKLNEKIEEQVTFYGTIKNQFMD